MEPIDAAAAREHLEMADRIIAQSSQRLCAGGEYFLVWGVYSGIATFCVVLVAAGILPRAALWGDGGLLLAAILFSVLRGRSQRGSATRRSLVQREFFNVLWLTIGLAFVVNLAAFNLFSGIGGAAIWSFSETIVLFYIGMHGNRRAQLAGVAVLASMIAANFMSAPESGFTLAIGMIVGYGGFGLSELLVRE